MTQIGDEKSPDSRRTLDAEARTRFAAFKAASIAIARRRAETEAGVTMLEKQLAEGLVADRASVGWYQGIGDSPPTAATRVALLKAREFASASTEHYLQVDVEYQKVLSHFENTVGKVAANR